MAHASAKKSQQVTGILRGKEYRKIFITRKSLTQPHMSPEANINFRIIINSGSIVYAYVYILPYMSVPVFAFPGIHL